MRLRTAFFLLFIWIVWSPASAQAQDQPDFAEYQRLVDEADAAYEQLQTSPEHLRPAMRENSIARDLAVIDWLDDFIVSEFFTTLAANIQNDARNSRYRYEYNLTLNLIDNDRCVEARDRIRALLDSSIDDTELRPRLTERYDEAIECIGRERVVSLTVEVTPTDAQLLLDGQFVGLATVTHSIPVGEYTLTVRADGYESHEMPLDASTEGDELNLGPIELVWIPVDTVKWPLWYEWTLWSVGVVGIGMGIGYYLAGESREDEVLNPPEGRIVVDEASELETADELRTIGFIAGGVGIAAAITGTVLFVIRDADDGSGEDDASIGPMFTPDGGGFVFTLPF